MPKHDFGYRTTVAKFPEKSCKLCVVRGESSRESATERKPDSGRPKTARTEKNVRLLIRQIDFDAAPAPLRQILS